MVAEGKQVAAQVTVGAWVKADVVAAVVVGQLVGVEGAAAVMMASAAGPAEVGSQSDHSTYEGNSLVPTVSRTTPPAWRHYTVHPRQSWLPSMCMRVRLPSLDSNDLWDWSSPMAAVAREVVHLEREEGAVGAILEVAGEVA